jgi:hypothetical protein
MTETSANRLPTDEPAEIVNGLPPPDTIASNTANLAAPPKVPLTVSQRIGAVQQARDSLRHLAERCTKITGVFRAQGLPGTASDLEGLLQPPISDASVAIEALIGGEDLQDMQNGYVSMRVQGPARDLLRQLLLHDTRWRSVGYTAFLLNAIQRAYEGALAPPENFHVPQEQVLAAREAAIKGGHWQ